MNKEKLATLREPYSDALDCLVINKGKVDVEETKIRIQEKSGNKNTENKAVEKENKVVEKENKVVETSKKEADELSPQDKQFIDAKDAYKKIKNANKDVENAKKAIKKAEKELEKAEAEAIRLKNQAEADAIREKARQSLDKAEKDVKVAQDNLEKTQKDNQPTIDKFRQTFRESHERFVRKHEKTFEEIDKVIADKNYGRQYELEQKILDDYYALLDKVASELGVFIGDAMKAELKDGGIRELYCDFKTLRELKGDLKKANAVKDQGAISVINEKINVVLERINKKFKPELLQKFINEPGKSPELRELNKNNWERAADNFENSEVIKEYDNAFKTVFEPRVERILSEHNCFGEKYAAVKQKIDVYKETLIKETKNQNGTAKESVNVEKVNESINNMISEILNSGKEQIKGIENLQQSEQLTQEEIALAEKVLETLKNNLNEGGYSLEAQFDILKESAISIMHQTIEANKRQLGDHGIRHIAGNIDLVHRATSIDAEFNTLTKVEQANILAETALGMVFHDSGYTAKIATETGQYDGTNIHRKTSQMYFNYLVTEGPLKGHISSKTISSIETYILTHDGLTIDLSTLGSRIRSYMHLADNHALAAYDKVPAFARVPGVLEYIVRLGKTKTSFGVKITEKDLNEIRNIIDKNVKNPNLRESYKNAVNEFNAKFTMVLLDMYSLSIKPENINYKSGETFPTITYERTPWTDLNDPNWGKQSTKAIEDYSKQHIMKDKNGNILKTEKEAKSTFERRFEVSLAMEQGGITFYDPITGKKVLRIESKQGSTLLKPENVTTDLLKKNPELLKIPIEQMTSKQLELVFNDMATKLRETNANTVEGNKIRETVRSTYEIMTGLESLEAFGVFIDIKDVKNLLNSVNALNNALKLEQYTGFGEKTINEISDVVKKIKSGNKTVEAIESKGEYVEVFELVSEVKNNLHAIFKYKELNIEIDVNPIKLKDFETFASDIYGSGIKKLTDYFTTTY